jgi:hypothetical protein
MFWDSQFFCRALCEWEKTSPEQLTERECVCVRVCAKITSRYWNLCFWFRTVYRRWRRNPHVGPSGEFDQLNFRNMMRGEHWRFIRRKLTNVLNESNSLKLLVYEALSYLNYLSELEKLIFCTVSSGISADTGAHGKRHAASCPTHSGILSLV